MSVFEVHDPVTGEVLEADDEALIAAALGLHDDGTPQFTRMDPALIQQAYTKLAHRYAKANAVANYLEEMRKPVRARLARGFRTQKNLGVAESGDAAEAHPEYRRHLRGMSQAREVAETAKGDLEAFRMAWETARTVAATERNAMKM